MIAPTNLVHTFAMRFAIDILFVARDGRVIKVRDGGAAAANCRRLGWLRRRGARRLARSKRQARRRGLDRGVQIL